MARSGLTMTIDLVAPLARIEIAGAALQGAINVMVAAGLSDAEIKSLLLQAVGSAADDLPTAAFVDDSDFDEDADGDSGTRLSRYDLDDAFERTSAFKTLERLSKRASAVSELDSDAACAKFEGLIIEALPQMKAALAWYQAECGRAGLALEFDRSEWLDNASDEELDNEDAHIFYEDTAAVQTFAPWTISQYARAAERFGRAEQLRAILEQIVAEEVILNRSAFDDLSEAFKHASLKAVIEAQVVSLDEGFEMPQSEFIQALVRVVEGNVSEYLIAGWLEDFATMGLVERYKRSNRWQIKRL